MDPEERAARERRWRGWMRRASEMIEAQQPETAVRFLTRRLAQPEVATTFADVAHEAHHLRAQACFEQWRQRGEQWPPDDQPELVTGRASADKALEAAEARAQSGLWLLSARLSAAAGQFEYALKDLGVAIAEFPDSEDMELAILCAASAGLRVEAYKSGQQYLTCEPPMRPLVGALAATHSLAPLSPSHDRHLYEQDPTRGPLKRWEYQFCLARVFALSGQDRVAHAGYERCWEERRSALRRRGYPSFDAWIADYRTWLHVANRLARVFLPVLEAHVMTEVVHCLHAQDEREGSATESSSEEEEEEKWGREEAAEAAAARRVRWRGPEPEAGLRAYGRRASDDQEALLHCRLVGCLERAQLHDAAAAAAELAWDMSPYDARVRRVLLRVRASDFRQQFDEEHVAAIHIEVPAAPPWVSPTPLIHH